MLFSRTKLFCSEFTVHTGIATRTSVYLTMIGKRLKFLFWLDFPSGNWSYKKLLVLSAGSRIIFSKLQTKMMKIRNKKSQYTCTTDSWSLLQHFYPENFIVNILYQVKVKRQIKSESETKHNHYYVILWWWCYLHN